MKMSTRETRSYKASDIANTVSRSLAGTVTVAASKEYVMKGTNAKIDSYAVVANMTRNLEKSLETMSKNKKKRIYRVVTKLNDKFTLTKLNSVLKLLAEAQGLSADQSAIFNCSIKEQSIQAKRKVYLDALYAMRKAQADYKEEKGDFYKNGLN